MSNFNKAYALTLKERSPNKLAAEVLQDPLYKDLPDTFSDATREKFFAFFRRYGTHYVSKVTLGGELAYYCAVDKSYNQTTEKMEAEAEAEYNAVFKASASASWTAVDTSWMQHREVTIESKPASSLSLKAPKFDDDLSRDDGYILWLTDAKVHPALLRFELESIAKIFSGSKRTAVLVAEEEYSESYIHVETSSAAHSEWPGNITLKGKPLKPQNADLKPHFVRQAIIDRRNLEVKLDKIYGWEQQAGPGAQPMNPRGGDMYEDILPYNESNYILVVTTLDFTAAKERLCVVNDMDGIHRGVSAHQRLYFELLRNAGAGEELDRYLAATPFTGITLSYLFIGALGRRSEACREKTGSGTTLKPAALSSFNVLLEPLEVGGRTLYRLIYV